MLMSVVRAMPVVMVPVSTQMAALGVTVTLALLQDLINGVRVSVIILREKLHISLW